MKRTLVLAAVMLVALCAFCVGYAAIEWQYELNDDGLSYTLTGFTGQLEYRAHIVIPDAYEGLPVTGIGSRALRGSVASIRLPSNPLTIDPAAFDGVSVEHLYLPSYTDDALIGSLHAINTIGKLTLPEECAGYALVNNALYSSDMTRLYIVTGQLAETTILPQTLVTIDPLAFKPPGGGKYLLSGAQITSVGENAFKRVNRFSVVYALKDSAVARAAAPYADSVFEYLTYEAPEVAFALNETGGYTISSATNRLSQHLSIPELIGGVQVTEVGAEAFRGLKFASITLPGSIRAIGESAFRESTVTSLTLPEGILAIGDNAFREGAFTSLTLPDSVEQIGAYAFMSAKGVAARLPGALVSIGDEAFRQCDFGDGELALPKSLTTTGKSILYGCKLGALILPDELDYDPAWFRFKVDTYFDLYYFSKPACFIRVSDTHPAYKMEGDILFSRDGRTLYNYPGKLTDGEYEVPEGVNHLAMGAFANTKIRSITFASTLVSIGEHCFTYSRITQLYTGPALETIGAHAFESCGKLEFVELEAVRSIGDYAFDECYGLEYVLLPDTIESIGSQALRTISSECIIYGFGGEARAYCIRENRNYMELVTQTSGGIEYRAYCIGGVFQYGVAGVSNTNTGAVVPRTFGGAKVTFVEAAAFKDATWLKSIRFSYNMEEIGPMAFSGCTSLTSVSLINSIVHIGDMAFMDCTALGSITIPDSVETIGSAVFVGCSNLQKINVNADNKAFKSLNGALSSKNGAVLYAYPAGSTLTACKFTSVTAIAPYAFYGANNLKTIEFPAVTVISDYAFAMCESVNRFTFSQKLAQIGAYAFAGCESLASFTINSGVTSIGLCSFLGCTSLETFALEPGTLSFSLRDGVLYSKSAGRLILCPPALAITEHNVPDNTLSVDSFAFAGCVTLERVTLGSSVHTLGDGVFAMCVNLEFVSIPATLTKFGGELFLGCPADMIVNCEYMSDIADYASALGFLCTHNYSTLVTLPGVIEVNLPVGESMRLIAPDEISNLSFSNASALKRLNGVNDIVYAIGVGDVNLTVSTARASYTLAVHVYEGDACVEISAGALRIESEAFAGCESVRRVRIPDTVLEIADDAFISTPSPTILCSMNSFAEAYALAHGFAVLYLG